MYGCFPVKIFAPIERGIIFLAMQENSLWVNCICVAIEWIAIIFEIKRPQNCCNKTLVSYQFAGFYMVRRQISSQLDSNQLTIICTLKSVSSVFFSWAKLQNQNSLLATCIESMQLESPTTAMFPVVAVNDPLLETPIRARLGYGCLGSGAVRRFASSAFCFLSKESRGSMGRKWNSFSKICTPISARSDRRIKLPLFCGKSIIWVPEG